MTEEQEAAVRRYEAARKTVMGQPTIAQGGKRAEVKYAEAYQGMVRAGVAPQLKRKYRPVSGA